MRRKHAAIQIQRVYRGHRARKHYRKQRHDIIMVQACARRRTAGRELKRLKVEARSANHFQQKAGALEKKVFELTQLLATKESSSKTLNERLQSMESQAKHWKERQEKTESKRVDAETRTSTILTALRSDLDQLKSEKEHLEQQLTHANSTLRSRDEECLALRKELELLKEDNQKLRTLSHTTVSRKEDQDRITTLQGENALLKDKIAKTVLNKGKSGMAKSNSNHSLESPATSAGVPFSKPIEIVSPPPVDTLTSPTSPKRSRPRTRSRGHSMSSQARRIQEAAVPVEQGTVVHEPGSIFPGPRNADGRRGSEEATAEIMGILQDPALDRELIETLTLPSVVPAEATLTDGSRQEVFFPAHLIGLCIIQGWRFGMTERVKNLLYGVVKALRENVVSA